MGRAPVGLLIDQTMALVVLELILDLISSRSDTIQLLRHKYSVRHFSAKLTAVSPKEDSLA